MEAVILAKMNTVFQDCLKELDIAPKPKPAGVPTQYEFREVQGSFHDENAGVANVLLPASGQFDYNNYLVGIENAQWEFNFLLSNNERTLLPV